MEVPLCAIVVWKLVPAAVVCASVDTVDPVLLTMVPDEIGVKVLTEVL